MITAAYRTLFPASFRDWLYKAFLGDVVFFFRNFKLHVRSKFTFLFYPLLPKNELNRALAFMGRHGLTSYPASYMLKYKKLPVDLQWDDTLQLHFCWHNHRKLYFTEAFDRDRIIRLYKSLVTEQDVSSAHRYITNSDCMKDVTLLDVGSAEGIFSLDHIEEVKHVYLFEVEPYWIKALEATFAPWKHKVTIVKKYIGNENKEGFVTLDAFLKDVSYEKLFIKMDIEGAEWDALQGAQKTLSASSDIQVAVCTYHRLGDPEKFNAFLTSNQFVTEFSEGFLFWGRRLSKAVIRGVKRT